VTTPTLARTLCVWLLPFVVIGACQSQRVPSPVGSNIDVQVLISSSAWSSHHNATPPIAVSTVSATPVPAGRQCDAPEDCSWWQEPDPRLQCCGGECQNTASSATNCGSCGNTCPGSLICSNGTCVTATAGCGSARCGTGEVCCSGLCVTPSGNRQNCGSCGESCRFAGAPCQSGVCCAASEPTASCHSSSCPDNFVRCHDGTCRDVTSDTLNCGGCSRPCGARLAHCVAGNCVL
jgi:hypothetical protein